MGEYLLEWQEAREQNRIYLEHYRRSTAHNDTIKTNLPDQASLPPPRLFVKYCKDLHLAKFHHRLVERYQQDSVTIMSTTQEDSNQLSVSGRQPRQHHSQRHSHSPPPLTSPMYNVPYELSSDYMNEFWDFTSIVTSEQHTKHSMREWFKAACNTSASASSHIMPTVHCVTDLNDNLPSKVSSQASSQTTTILADNHNTDDIIDDNNIDDYRFVYFGPYSSWTPLHRDVYGSYSWSGNVTGVKLWLFFPPSMIKLLQSSPTSPQADLYDVFDSSNASTYPQFYAMFAAWTKKLRQRVSALIGPTKKDETETPHVASLHQHDQHPSNPDGGDGEDEPIALLQFPGDVVFVPSLYSHTVINLTDCISINHNWTNSHGLPHVTSQILLEYLAVKNEMSTWGLYDDDGGDDGQDRERKHQRVEGKTPNDEDAAADHRLETRPECLHKRYQVSPGMSIFDQFSHILQLSQQPRPECGEHTCAPTAITTMDHSWEIQPPKQGVQYGQRRLAEWVPPPFPSCMPALFQTLNSLNDASPIRIGTRSQSPSTNDHWDDHQQREILTTQLKDIFMSLTKSHGNYVRSPHKYQNPQPHAVCTQNQNKEHHQSTRLFSQTTHKAINYVVCEQRILQSNAGISLATFHHLLTFTLLAHLGRLAVLGQLFPELYTLSDHGGKPKGSLMKTAMMGGPLSSQHTIVLLSIIARDRNLSALLDIHARLSPSSQRSQSQIGDDPLQGTGSTARHASYLSFLWDSLAADIVKLPESDPNQPPTTPSLSYTALHDALGVPRYHCSAFTSSYHYYFPLTVGRLYHRLHEGCSESAESHTCLYHNDPNASPSSTANTHVQLWVFALRSMSELCYAVAQYLTVYERLLLHTDLPFLYDITSACSVDLADTPGVESYKHPDDHADDNHDNLDDDSQDTRDMDEVTLDELLKHTMHPVIPFSPLGGLLNHAISVIAMHLYGMISNLPDTVWSQHPHRGFSRPDDGDRLQVAYAHCCFQFAQTLKLYHDICVSGGADGSIPRLW